MGQEDSFAQFLSELRAERKSKSFDQMAERLIAERGIRRFFSSLREKGFIVQENLDEAVNFDFLLRKGDDELVGLLKYKEDNFFLSRQQLYELYRILSANPQSSAILFVWVGRPSYPSICLSMGELNKIVRQGKDVYDFSSYQSPLEESVSFFFKRPKSLVRMLKPKEKAMISKKNRMILTETFAKLIMSSFRKTKKRRFRLKHKIKAAKEFSIDDVKSLEKVFQAAINKEFDKKLLESCIKEISGRG